ncbi:hypothetical protein TNCV_2973491 [Trichonephila clavipes]|nr:hypothetical protein TNCV_2973491 [Trichonephila clavipes]
MPHLDSIGKRSGDLGGQGNTSTLCRKCWVTRALLAEYAIEPSSPKEDLELQTDSTNRTIGDRPRNFEPLSSEKDT